MFSALSWSLQRAETLQASSKCINRNRIPIEEAKIWSYMIQMTRGLKSLHEMKICHRDLKAANVFVTKDGVLKLGDMNVSKVADHGLMQTQTGTPYYCSPEIWKGQSYDYRSDIWSLGCVVYELIMLRPPFTALNIKDLSTKACRGVYPAISSNYSKSLSNVVKKMLQVLPSQRITSFKLLELPEFELNVGKTCANLCPDNMSKDLLGTILMPRNMRELSSRLPRAKYSRKGMRRMNSEQFRLPSIHEDKERVNSAAARRRWDIDKEGKFIIILLFRKFT